MAYGAGVSRICAPEGAVHPGEHHFGMAAALVDMHL